MVHHRDTESTEATEHQLSGRVISAAIEVHRALGPGLLESAYRDCLAHELMLHGLRFTREVPLALTYKGRAVRSPYRLDLLVEGRLVAELKAVEELIPIHSAQLLTYLRLSGIRFGLLINFNVPVLAQGVRRMVNGW